MSAATIAMTKITTVPFHPNRPLSPAEMRTESTTLKATKVKNVATSASKTPRYPSCARDWIICGNPSCAPCMA
jgi:hypothetical protein